MADNIFHVEPLEEIIDTIFYTAWIPHENPLSVIIIGPSGCGKTMIVCRVKSVAFCRTDSISSQGLYDIAKADEANQHIKFLLIPDFNPTLSRKSSTVDATLANLLSFTSDGVVRIDDGRRDKQCRHNPVGMITASTPEIYRKHAKKWYNLGLRRRILPLFFSYSFGTLDALQTKVKENNIHTSLPAAIEFYEGIEKVTFRCPSIPASIENDIQRMSIQLAAYLGKDAYFNETTKKIEWSIKEFLPLTPQLILRNLARANALKHKREEVTGEDYAFLLRFIDFCDPANPRKL